METAQRVIVVRQERTSGRKLEIIRKLSQGNGMTETKVTEDRERKLFHLGLQSLARPHELRQSTPPPTLNTAGWSSMDSRGPQKASFGGVLCRGDEVREEDGK